MIELLCTLTGIIAGVAVVASLMHKQEDRQRFAAVPDSTGSDKILGIADQLQAISYRMVADVKSHSEKVVNISDKLTTEDEQPEQINSSINDIISANQAMQSQLADAQQRIAQQSRMIEHASKQARTDALTGLNNRRALNEFLANCLSSFSETEVTGLLLMDIDHFKNFNDSFGHTTGDAVLASFARALTNCGGDECYTARYGGEEFAVLLSAANAEELVRKAVEIRYFVSEQVIRYEDLQLKITASAGLCILAKEDTCNSVYERADEGLYQSKKAGRNRGFWLSSDGWLPFPVRSGDACTLADLKTSSQIAADAVAGVRSISQVQAEISAATKPTSPSPTAVGDALPPKSVVDMSKTPAVADTSRTEPSTKTIDKSELSEILELSSFLVKLEAYLEQLGKAQLPSSAIMIEAIGLSTEQGADAVKCWECVVQCVQRNLRGIDVACLYRPCTLCIFIPGCSLDAGIGRAAKIKRLLLDSMDSWNTNVVPEKMAVGVAAASQDEGVANFLNRLEMALDEAADTTDSELVVHNGDACHFQEV